MEAAKKGRLTTADRLRRASAAAGKAEEWELCGALPWSGDTKPRRSLPVVGTVGKAPPPARANNNRDGLPPHPPRHPSQVLAEMLAKARAEKSAAEEGEAAEAAEATAARALGSGASSQPSASEASTSHNSPSPSPPPTKSAAEASEDIIDCLPTSLDDFESAERDLNLARALGSPALLSPTTPRQSLSPLLGPCGELAEDSPVDAEDMEVAMINDSYEEAQKQRRLYQSSGLKNIFYSRPNPLASPPGSYDNIPAEAGLDTAAVDSLAATVSLQELSARALEEPPPAMLPSTSGMDQMSVLAEAGSKLAAMTGTRPPPLTGTIAGPPSIASPPREAISWAGWGGGVAPNEPPDDPSSALAASAPFPSSPPSPCEEWREASGGGFSSLSASAHSALPADCLHYLERLSQDIIESVLGEQESEREELAARPVWTSSTLPSAAASSSSSSSSLPSLPSISDERLGRLSDEIVRSVLSEVDAELAGSSLLSADSPEPGPPCSQPQSPLLQDSLCEDLNHLMEEVVSSAIDVDDPSPPPPSPPVSVEEMGEAGHSRDSPSKLELDVDAEVDVEEEEEAESWEALADDDVLSSRLQSISLALDKVKTAERRREKESQSVASPVPHEPSPPDSHNTRRFPRMLELTFPASTKRELIHQSLLSLRLGEFKVRPLSSGALVSFASTKDAETTLEAFAGGGLPSLSGISASGVGSAEAVAAAREGEEERRGQRSSAVARRLVEGHLGMRSALPAEARAAESDKIRKARETKRSKEKEAQAKVAASLIAWEGL